MAWFLDTRYGAAAVLIHKFPTCSGIGKAFVGHDRVKIYQRCITLLLNRITFNKKFLKKAENIIAIILVNILLIAVLSSVATKSTPYESVEVLSKLGSRGSEVRRIQTELRNLGIYGGSVDGVYGVRTVSAVKQFQRNCGLTVDGIAGPKTLLYLGITTSASSTSSNDMYLLAKVIAAEGRGESYTGQVAIGAVILNRVDHPSFPDSISGAQDALNGWDPAGGAIYYYNPNKTTNQWIRARPVIVVIGDHVFCR